MKVVYTCITNQYDYLKDPVTIWRPGTEPLSAYNPDWRYVLFTDRPDLYESEIWEVVHLKNPTTQRQLKTNPIKYLTEYLGEEPEYCLYIDSSYQLLCDPEVFVTFLTEPTPIYQSKGSKHVAEILLKLHHERKTIGEEAEAIIEQDKATEQQVKSGMNWVDANAAIGPPVPLFESGIHAYRVTPKVKQMFSWWSKGVEACHRDQLSLPVAVQRSEVAYSVLAHEDTQRLAGLFGHSEGKKNLVTTYLPYAIDGNLGAEYNRLIDECKTDWLCFMDGDAMFTDNFWGMKFHRLIEDNPEIDIFVCTTNRLSDDQQLFGGVRSEDPSLLSHKAISDACWKEFGTKVVETTKPPAGLLMLMRKETGEAVRFRNGLARMDTDFFTRAFQLGVRVGIAKGLYVTHYYRLLEGKDSLSHLVIPHRQFKYGNKSGKAGK